RRGAVAGPTTHGNRRPAGCVPGERTDPHRGQRHDAAYLGAEFARERDWITRAAGQGRLRGVRASLILERVLDDVDACVHHRFDLAAELVRQEIRGPDETRSTTIRLHA